MNDFSIVDYLHSSDYHFDEICMKFSIGNILASDKISSDHFGYQYLRFYLLLQYFKLSSFILTLFEIVWFSFSSNIYSVSTLYYLY